MGSLPSSSAQMRAEKGRREATGSYSTMFSFVGVPSCELLRRYVGSAKQVGTYTCPPRLRGQISISEGIARRGGRQERVQSLQLQFAEGKDTPSTMDTDAKPKQSWLLDGPGKAREYNIQKPSLFFVRSIGSCGLAIAIVCCIFGSWKPHLFRTIAKPLYTSLSSLFLGVYTAQYSFRHTRMPAVTLSISMLMRMATPVMAWFIGNCLGFDAPTLAGIVLVGAGPIGFTPLLAIVSGHIYLQMYAVLCALASSAAFMVVPAAIHMATGGVSSVSPLLVAGLISAPFFAGYNCFDALPARHAALLGRLSAYLSWFWSLPQLLTVIAQVRLGIIPLRNVFEVLGGVLTLGFLVLGMVTLATIVTGTNDPRIKHTWIASVGFPVGVLGTAIAAHGNSISPLPCIVTLVLSTIGALIATQQPSEPPLRSWSK